MTERNSTPTGYYMFPLFNGGLDADTNVKLNEDTYEVYVNESFVGHKTLKTQGENLTDIDDFLRNQGFSDFTSSLDGDHYVLHVKNQDDDISNALSVYINNR